MKEDTINLIPISGGKDSQATAIMASMQGVENQHYVFADTGIEHELTYEHLDYLEQEFGQHITRLKADFRQQIEQKRYYVDFVWRGEGVSNDICDRALEVLHPTGIPFLDMCLWKGRFPGHASAAFCTFELKQKPLEELQQYLFKMVCKNLIVWQGTRREESRKRRNLTPWEAEIGDIYERTGFLVHRPIVYWPERDVFKFLSRSGQRINPLYAKGMKRVGCMPCKNEIKSSIRTIDENWPEYIDRVEEFERLVSMASKIGVSVFFDGRVTANYLDDPNIIASTHGVRTHVKWANSSKAGRFWHQEMFPTDEGCSLAGFCE